MAGQGGMNDGENVREALIELKTMRERERSALRESNAIVDALAAITDADSPAIALMRLLQSIQASLSCGHVLHVRADGAGASIAASTSTEHVGLSFPDAVVTAQTASRVVDTSALTWWSEAPQALRTMRSALAAPITIAGDPPGAIVCLAREPAHFDTAAKTLLTRLTALAAQALRTLAIAERNTLLAGVIDGTSASVSIADARTPDLPLIYVNDSFVRLSGYSREEVIGKNCRFLSDEPDDSPERQRLRETIARRGAGTFVIRNRTRDGKIFWNKLTLYAICDAAGHPEHMVATQVDITAERAAEAARRDAESHLSTAMSATSEGILLLDAGGRVVFANQQFADFYGAEGTVWTTGTPFEAAWSQRLVALGLAQCEAEEHAAKRIEAMRKGAANEEEHLPDGRILLRNDRSLDTGGLVSITTDITSLKATERLLAQRAAAIDATQDGIAVTDETGCFVYMNAAHLSLFGFTDPAEIIGRPWRTLYEPAQADFIQRVGMPALRRDGQWRTEISGRARDGSPVQQEVSLTLLDGIGLVCVTRDISDRQRNERERARLRDQLATAQRQEAVGQLAAGIAHDFNNLLSVITTSANLVSQDLDPADAAHVHINRIIAAGTRAAGLVGRLLETGRRGSAPRRVDASAAVREAAELLTAGVPSRIAVSVDVPETPLILHADPGDILQVVLNLGINARDALNQDAGEIDVTLTADATLPDECKVGMCDANKTYAALSVRDSGPGIPETVQESIFKPYFTTKGNDGTGLGLAVVSSIVRKIRGGLDLVSTPQDGTTFTVFWPTQPVQAVAKQPNRAEQPVSTSLQGHTIIVCEDEPAVAETLQAILENAGAEAAVCDDPRDVIDVIREEPTAISLLLTDFDMPHMTGAELARAARAVRADLPIILCTALAERYGDADVFDATLPKPVNAAALVDSCARAIAHGRQESGVPAQ